MAARDPSSETTSAGGTTTNAAASSASASAPGGGGGDAQQAAAQPPPQQPSQPAQPQPQLQQQQQPRRVCWNHGEFTVRYRSALCGELCVGGAFVRLLLEGASSYTGGAGAGGGGEHAAAGGGGGGGNEGPIGQVRDPAALFSALYHAFLTSADTDVVSVPLYADSPWGGADMDTDTAGADPRSVRVLCAHAMAAVYDHHHGKIGAFPGSAHVVAVCDRTLDRALRCRLLQLVAALLRCKANCAPLISAGARCCCISVVSPALLSASSPLSARAG